EDVVKGQGFNDQPNAFDSKQIESEVTDSSGGSQPAVNTPMGRSSTWQAIYQGALSGQFIPVPYHDVKVTDPNKLQYVSDEYKKFMTQGGTLPDTRRVFLDDAFEELLFRSRAGASGHEVLVQTCAQCHNPRLDQDVSRAKFDVTKLDSMSSA